MARRIIQVGDWFVRRSNPRLAWVVERVFDYTDIPPHARLVERGGTRVITLATSVLSDERQFTFVVQPEDHATA